MRSKHPFVAILMVCVAAMASACGGRDPQVTLNAYADGNAIQNGDVFEESFMLTGVATVNGVSSSDLEVRLNTHRVDLEKGLEVGPGVYTLAVTTADPRRVLFTPKTLRFEVKDPKAPLECVARASVSSTNGQQVVTVFVEGCADAMPTQWSVGVTAGGRNRGSYSLASYRLEGGRPRLDDPTDAVFENGQWRLRFVIARSEVPDPIERISLTGFTKKMDGKDRRPIWCWVSF